MRIPRQLTAISLTITFFVSVLTLLSFQISSLQSSHVFAAGVGPSQCIKKKPTDCSKPTDLSNPSGGGGSTTVGSNTPADQAACAGLNQLGGTSCNSNAGQTAISSVANRVVNIISYIAGIAAIIMIIISGVRYTTSGGDQARVSSAKTALIYALIGIAIAALAQILVHFVINTVNGGTNGVT